MIDKQKLRESVAQILQSNNHNEFRYIDKEILHSKEFIQKIYRKSYRLFNWLPAHLETLDVYKEVIEDQDYIELGNAFNKFCQTAKLIKPNYKVNLEEMNRHEIHWFEAFLPMYNTQKELLSTVRKVSDYLTYELASQLDPETEINIAGFYSSDNVDRYQTLATEHLIKLGDKSHV